MPTAYPKAHFDSSSKLELADPREHNLKSTSLIMRTMRSASQFDEAMKELEGIPSKDPLEPWTRAPNEQRDLFSRSSQLITNMNAITKVNPGDSANWWKGEKSPSPSRRYSSSVDGDTMLSDEFRFESNARRQRRFSHENAVSSASSSSFLAKLSPSSSGASANQTTTYESNLKHVNHLNVLLEETRRLSDKVDGQLTSKITPRDQEINGSKKPIAAPRMKKLGSSSVMSQLTQLRRMYEAADEPESDTSTKADQEVSSYLGDRDVELFSGSWSKVKAKRNSAILSDIRNDHDLYLGTDPPRKPSPSPALRSNPCKNSNCKY